MNTILNKLLDKKDLTQKESENLAKTILRGKVSQIQIGAILTALCSKGESVDELTGFIYGIKTHMAYVNGPDAIDVCGTGGDGKSTFNISTVVAFVVSGAGVRVAKHGNRAVSSTSGSADVLEALGVHIILTPIQVEEVLRKVGLVFLFAPLFHPTFKHVMPVRKELGVKTIFNYLGPFINPAKVKRQIIGVPSLNVAKKLAHVATNLRYDHLLIVTSKDGMDEISVASKTHAFEVKGKSITQKIIDPQEYGFKKVPFKEFLGGTATYNAKITLDILNNKKGPKRDIVILNSAFALFVAGKVNDVPQGIELAEKVIASGKAKDMLENLVKETQKYA